MRFPSFSHWRLVTTALVLLVVPFGILAFLYVEAKEEYFTQRNFRLLGLMANDLRLRTENIGNSVLPNAVREAEKRYRTYPAADEMPGEKCLVIDRKDFPHLGPKDFGRQYLVVRRLIALVPDLTLECVTVAKPASRPVAVVRPAREEGSFRAQFIYHGSGNTGYTLKVRAQVSMEELLGPAGEGAFEHILVADRSGRVIYQSGAAVAPVLRLDRLLTSKSGVGPPSDSSSKGTTDLATSDWANIRESSGLYPVEFAGTKYLLFLQPVQIALAPEALAPEASGAGTGPTPITYWLVGGLVDQGRFRAQTLAISYTVLLLFLFLLLLVTLSWPFLKIWQMGNRERLRASDVMFLYFSALMVTALLSFFLFDLYAYKRGEELLDDQLEKLSGQVAWHFKTELNQIHRALNRMTCAARPTTHGEESTETEILRKVSEPSARQPNDPWWEIVTWVSPDGRQKRKWTIAETSTALVNVRERAYFHKVRHGFGWRREFPADADTCIEPEFWLEPVVSWNTGKSLAIYSAPVRQELTNEGASSEGSASERGVVTMAANLLSLRQVVLPPGFGFAVIDGDGDVQFHSDPERHRQENLFKETDGNRALQAAVLGQASEWINASYIGTDHRMYVRPLGSPPWFVIVYRDKEIFRTVNLEILSMSLILFLFYVLLALGPIMGIWFWRSGCLWKDDTYHIRYNQLSLGHAANGLVFLMAILYFEPHEILFATLVLPPFGLLLTYLRLTEPAGQSRRDDCLAPWQDPKARWRRVSAYMALGLLLVPLLIWLARDRHWGQTAFVVLGMAVSTTAFLAKPSLRGGRYEFTLRQGYLFFMTVLVCLVGVLPSLAFFKIAYDTEMRLFVRHAQLQLYRGLIARERLLRETYRGLAAPDVMRQRLGDHTDVYQCFFFPVKDCAHKQLERITEDLPQTEASCREDNPLASLLQSMRPLYNRTASETHQLMYNRTANCLYQWKEEKGTTKLTGPTLAHLSVPPMQIPDWKWPQQPSWILALIAVVMSLVLLAFVVARFVSRHVFLLDVTEPESPRGQPPDIEKLDHNVLILGPPFSGKSSAVRRNSVCYLDCRELARVRGDPRSLYQSEPPEKVIVVDHFDYKMGNPENNRRKLRLLESLLIDNRTVVVASAVDPMDLNFGKSRANEVRLSGASATQYRDRMAGVISTFTRIYVRKQEPTAGALGAEAGEAYYRALWACCSRDEKIALYDLAVDGFLNNHNPGIPSLLRNQLILRQPMPRLSSEGFRRFVAEEGRAENIQHWVQEDRQGNWGALKWVLLGSVVAVGLILFATQRQIFETSVVFVTAIGGGLAGIAKLLDLIRETRQVT